MCVPTYRALLAGDAYDLAVVFRLVQLWFSLGADKAVNAHLAGTFSRVPSHKFLVLAYQIASRLSAAKTGPYVESGFQVGRLFIRQNFICHLLSCYPPEACGRPNLPPYLGFAFCDHVPQISPDASSKGPAFHTFGALCRPLW